jgi:hypothetical protein
MRARLGYTLCVSLLLAGILGGAVCLAESRAKSGHWAFRPIARPAVPTVQNRKSKIENPVDAFILAGLEKRDITPSPEADRPTLIRRLSLDLLGLPPTPAEVDAFLSDHGPDAYERLVDRLLSSPHYGERWGRHWLDLARYADSDGYEKDNVRPWAWRYRDWVIDAVNRDISFDRFTIEQLAGDLLPNATLDQKVATGFHRNTLTNTEGGVDQEEFRLKATADRVNTTGTVWLGITVGCAECHNHKYDPVSQEEYYRLFAFFNAAKEANVPAPLPAELAAYEKAKQTFDEEHGRVTAEVAREMAVLEKDVLPQRQKAWEVEAARSAVRWTPIKPASAVSAEGATLTAQPDGAILVTGKNPATDVYTVATRSGLTGITAIRLEALADENLPSKGPGRTKHGNFVVNEFSLAVKLPDDKEPRAIPLRNASADYSQPEFAPSGAADGNPTTGWAIGPREGQRHLIVFQTPEPLQLPPGTSLTFTIDQRHGSQHTLGKFRISVAAGLQHAQAVLTPDAVADALLIPAERRSTEQAAMLAAYYRTIDPEAAKLTKKVADHAATAPKYPPTLAQTLTENNTPSKTYVHIRGDFQRHGAEVTPGTPSCLPALSDPEPRTQNPESPSRLDLARWLVDPANPLTPRVTVNRIWQHLFGRGIVATPEDFGTRGAKPTHPELLDWLASEFIRRGWSQKAMIKLIVTSRTYRQSSRIRPELLAKDANNLWLARQNRFRLEAENVRDVYLAASGLLNPAVGGPSIRPPLPADIAALGYAGSVTWRESKGMDKYRRGMYIFFQRTVPYPMLATFDSPDSNVCAARRERSNTPLQALTLLNDPVFVECAQALGRRAVREGGKAALDRARWLFKTCMSREPNQMELSEVVAAYKSMRARTGHDPELDAQMTGEELAPSAENAETAAWVAVARIVLNLDEFVTRE